MRGNEKSDPLNPLRFLSRPVFVQFFLFAVAGLIATATHMAVVVILVEMQVTNATVASAPAYIIANITGFFLNKYIVYRSKEKAHREYVLYFIISTGGFFANLGIMYVLTEIFSVWYPLAVIFVSGFLMVWSFVMHRLFTFANRQAHTNG